MRKLPCLYGFQQSMTHPTMHPSIQHVSTATQHKMLGCFSSEMNETGEFVFHRVHVGVLLPAD